MNKTVVNNRIAKVKLETKSDITPSLWEVNVSDETYGREVSILLNWKNISYLVVTGRVKECPEDFYGLLILGVGKGSSGFSRSMIAEAIRNSENYYLSDDVVEVFHSGLWERKVPVE